MNLKESIYVMLLQNELEKNNKDVLKSFFSIDKKMSEEQDCDVMVFSRPDLVDIATELSNQIDKKNDDIIVEEE